MKLLPSGKLSEHLISLFLQKCTKSKALAPCKKIHALILTSKIDQNILSLNSKFVGAYASCGDLCSAKLVFQGIAHPNIFAFNWMISALTFNGLYQEALGYFILLQKLGISWNRYTISGLVKACVGLMYLKMGKEVHAVIYRMGFDSDMSVCNAMIDMYGKCGAACYARTVFDKMVDKDVTSWTAMICGYFTTGKFEQSVDLFERMYFVGLKPNEYTWNAMITGHSRRGDCDNAFAMFSRMSREGLTPDLITWNAMISGFVQSQRNTEAMELFRNLLIIGIKPNQVTVTGLLPACSSLCSISKGKEIHGLIYRIGLDINAFVASALIDMYARCGCVWYAWGVFNTSSLKNVATWNSMIKCYGMHGKVGDSIQLFERMLEEGVQANEVTFVSVLSACSHGGLVETGMRIFKLMKEIHAIVASKEHYACVVDLLCRSGRIEEAYDIIKEIPGGVTNSIAGAFFHGCKVHERRDLAEKMAQGIFCLDMEKPGQYVTLSNIYAAEGVWKEVENMRKVMKDKGVQKMPGSSWASKTEDE